MTRAWEHAQHFDLFDDVVPALDDLRARGLKIGLLSNTARDLDAFVDHHALVVDAALTSRAHGKTKPHESIFLRMLELLGVSAGEAAMVGDTVEDDVEGARAVGMQAVLLDRDGLHPDVADRLTDLRGLPAALKLRP
jgi:putative hydrolase of the HAD superfamily